MAEAVGTFVLVLSILVSGGNAIIVGGALALIIFIIGAVSGGHVNPAVSLAMVLGGSLTGAEMIGYVLSQLAGGAGAAWLFRALAR